MTLVQENTKWMVAHQGMHLEFAQHGDTLVQTALNTSENRKDRVAPISLPNFQLGLTGKPRGVFPVPLGGMTSIPAECTLLSKEQREDGLLLTYLHAAYNLQIQVRMTFIPGANVIRQTTTVVNTGTEPVLMNHLSSMSLSGIATDGVRHWQDPKKIRVHYAMQTWHGEGQWRTGNLEDLGLYHGSPHPPSNTIRFSSVGSFSTAKYLPMLVLEDMETGKVWYFQVETSTSWNIEIGFRGSWNDDSGCLYVHTDAGSERFGGWKKQLLPGESYTSVPTAYGCSEGGFNEAVSQLTSYRRSTLKPAPAWEGEFPLVYNDFMNGIWGLPTRERLIPLIDAAAEAGAECFCIDAGWFMEHTEVPVQKLGDWLPVDERFGEGGLQGILDYIASRGMMPGIWLEIEMCHEESSIAAKDKDWYLYRNGVRIGGPDRVFLNFSNPEVCAYFEALIDRLTGMGVRFIKNDYNDFIPVADSPDGVSVDDLRRNADAFYAFIDGIRRRHPQLILENCGSGGMREDYAALSHFHLQSTSDQEFYYNYPSILQGSLAAILPEQAGIWAYPYPLAFLEQNTPGVVLSESFQAKMKDGEETVFNMINGLCGNMYLAGHLYAADSWNMALIQQATALYKQERGHIRRSVPVYPTGLLKLKEQQAWGSIGLWHKDQNRMLLAVWRLGSAEDRFEVPLNDWFSGETSIRQLYPQEDVFQAPFYYSKSAGKLTVHFSKPYTARFYEVTGRVQ
ncbi:glycoside hydrolase family 36 protein [Paenibacillus gansuensis]|uniref:Glycoside hydrolase family 36 protein n=1 Tax=Paenibacillus gansuensis TaxID=306542 RepID=A0ABW5PDD9_9BACL